MPAEVYWYHEKRIIYHRYLGNITVAEVHEAAEKGLQLTAAGAPPIHVLVDLSEVSSFPRSIDVYRAALKPAEDPATIGWVVIFGSQNLVLKFMASTLAHIAGARTRVRVVESRDHAVSFLEERDSSLINLERYRVNPE
jgi:hypothetical protein